jgi:putative DNA methylase
MSTHEVITRRNLPHWYVPGAFHFVTFRLFGSLPQEIRDRLQEERRRERLALGERASVATERDRLGKKWFGRYDAELDRGRGPAFLRLPPVAAQVRRSLYFLHGEQYYLWAYCIMPNHVHALIQPLDGHVARPQGPEDAEDGEGPDAASPLAKVMHSLKSYTAHQINKLLGRSGTFWQDESYDRWVRDEGELERIVDYIAANPVKTGFVRCPHEWYFSSAHDRHLHDGSEHTWLELPMSRSTGVPPVAGHRRDACATKTEPLR